jgi:hypothetical protein
MPVATREDRIRRFRVADQSADVLALRRRVERAFAGRAFRPAGVSASAIVCVRSFRTPRPIGSVGWREHFDHEIQRVVAGAVRPFRETVPAGALAVAFEDEAELLACLARDWRRGDGGAWWWCALVGHAISEDDVVAELIKSPQAVPAAIESLALTGMVREVIGGLSTASCTRLLNDLAAAFAVPNGDAALTADPDRVDRRIEGLLALAPRLQRRAEAAVMLPPGQRLRDIELAQRRLVATALMLNRDPTIARTPNVVAAIAKGWCPETETTLATFPAAYSSPSAGEDASSAQASPLISRSTSRDGSRPADYPSIRLSPPPVADAVVIDDHRRGRPRDRRPSIDAPAVELEARSPVSHLPERTLENAAWPPTRTMTFVESAFAGVLYLINVALHLEWYGDFTQPTRPGLALPIGDFLALVGERVCGQSLRRDPLWILLAGFADREPDDPPGADATPPEGLTLQTWVDSLTGQLAERTATAIGVEPELALSFLCIRAGRMALSATRLDVEFALADHALVLRLAGLDRNPGWVPAAGRIVEFHFR